MTEINIGDRSCGWNGSNYLECCWVEKEPLCVENWFLNWNLFVERLYRGFFSVILLSTDIIDTHFLLLFVVVAFVAVAFGFAFEQLVSFFYK